MKYAIKVADDRGIRIAASSDLPLNAQFQLIQALGGRLKLAFDTHAPLVYGTGAPADLIQALGKQPIEHFRMRDFHLDAKGFIPDENTSIALLGRGEIHFRDTVRAIQGIGSSGWIISKSFYYRPNLTIDGEDPVSLAGKDLETLKGLFEGE